MTPRVATTIETAPTVTAADLDRIALAFVSDEPRRLPVDALTLRPLDAVRELYASAMAYRSALQIALIQQQDLRLELAETRSRFFNALDEGRRLREHVRALERKTT